LYNSRKKRKRKRKNSRARVVVTPVIPAAWEVKVEGQFARPYLKNKLKTKRLGEKLK
jgi:hypothetical protein